MASRTAAGVDLAKYGLAPERNPRSAAAKGSYYKARTKAWFEARGWTVLHLERMMWIRGGPACATCAQPRMFASKQDQAGSDLLAFRSGPGPSAGDWAEPALVFIQVKLGTKAVLDARREFLRFDFPPFAQRWIVCWEPRARDPEIIDCTGDTAATVPVRRARAPKETLF